MAKVTKVSKKNKKQYKNQSITEWYGDLSTTTKVLAGVGVGVVGFAAYLLNQFQK